MICIIQIFLNLADMGCVKDNFAAINETSLPVLRIDAIELAAINEDVVIHDQY